MLIIGAAKLGGQASSGTRRRVVRRIALRNERGAGTCRTGGAETIVTHAVAESDGSARSNASALRSRAVRSRVPGRGNGWAEGTAGGVTAAGRGVAHAANSVTRTRSGGVRGGIPRRRSNHRNVHSAPSNAPAHLRAPCRREDARMLRGSPEDGTPRGLPVRCSATLDGSPALRTGRLAPVERTAHPRGRRRVAPPPGSSAAHRSE